MVAFGLHGTRGNYCLFDHFTDSIWCVLSVWLCSDRCCYAISDVLHAVLVYSARQVYAMDGSSSATHARGGLRYAHRQAVFVRI